jgi:hypothetical protein
MRHNLLWLGLAVAVLAEGGTVGQPVLVELFTSEGCSSCPPADALLEKLDRQQPVAGAQIIVLSEHVDYWNGQTWADPYSSRALTARQDQYAHRFGLGDPYTPEMVVDGSVELVGSDAAKAQAAIRAASAEPKVGVRIRAAEAPDAVAVEVDPFPPGKNHKANVYVANAADSGTSDVLGGENRGRRLHYVSIAKEIQKVGSVGGSGFKTQIQLRAAKTPPGSRLIVFVQEPDNGRVWGAAMYPIPLQAAPPSVPSSK